MQTNKKVFTVVLTALLLFSMLAFAATAFAAITPNAPSAVTGPVGTKVTLTGTGASAGGQVQVFWDTQASTPLNTTSALGDGTYSVIAIIPDATAGAHFLITKDVSSGVAVGQAFTVTSQITLTPGRGIPGDAVSVAGTGFATIANITIKFNGADVTAATTTSSVTGNFSGSFAVPNVAYATYPVVANDNATLANTATANFIVGASVTISPTQGPAGTLVTATGRGFTHTANLAVILTIGTFPALNTTNIKTLADGTFTGQFLVPSGLTVTTRYTITASDGTISGSTSGATGGFKVTADTKIIVSPTSQSPGGSVTVTGTGFAQIAGVTVSIRFGSTAAGTFIVGTVGLPDTSGNFSAVVTVPSLPTAPYFFNATDAFGLNATSTFAIAITAVFATPSSGPSGTVVTLTGFGFTPSATFNVTLGGFLMTPLSSNLVSSLAAGTAAFTVPTIAAGAKTVIVTDATGLTATTTFTVTATSTLAVTPAQAPGGVVGVTLVVSNFAAGESVNFYVANSTYSTALTVSPAAVVNGSLLFTGTFTVPALNLGTYTLIANTTDAQFNATTAFTVGAALISVNTRSATYGQGATVSFNIQSTFAYAITVTIVDPTGYPATTFSIGLGQWVAINPSVVGGAMVVPYSLTSYTLSSDAATGTWAWTTTVGASALNGTFQVTALASTTDLNTTLAGLNSNLNKLNATVAAIQGSVVTLTTSVGSVQTTLNALNATLIAVNGNTATLSTSIGTLNTNIQGVSSSVSGISSSISGISSSISGISGSITSISNGLATVTTSVGTIQTKLDNLNAVLGAVAGQNVNITTSLGTITTSLSSIGTTVTSISGDTATIKTDLGTITGTVTSISGDTATIKTNLGTMQTSIANLQTGVNGVQSSVNGVQTDVTSIKSTTAGLSPLIIVAIVLALIAAIAAIASIVLMRRKIAG